MTESLDLLRVYDTARTAHLERLREWPATTLMYRRQNYDFDESMAIELGAVRASRRKCALKIAARRRGLLELNEPAQLNAWPSLLIYLAIISCLRALRVTDIRVGCYAIDNSDLCTNVDGYLHSSLRPIGRFIARFCFIWMVSVFDTVIFGTEDARKHYQRYCHDLRGEVVWPLEPPALRTDTDLPARSGRALFVGSLEDRKGLPLLMRAWEGAYSVNSWLTLRILGVGPLEQVVKDWARDRSEVMVGIGPKRLEVERAYADADCVVLLSQRTHRWREQIGLSMVEALSYGCEIVTTDETGIAGWLREHGHRVLSAQASSGQFADALAAASCSVRPRREVLESLPSRSGRQEADITLRESLIACRRRKMLFSTGFRQEGCQ